MPGNSRVAAVVMAAGRGKRMRSETPKALHRVCGRAVIDFVLDAVRDVEPGLIVVVVSPRSEPLREQAGSGCLFAEQAEPLGTGHAVQTALEKIGPGFDEMLVLPGDSPLISADTLQRLLDERRRENAAAAMMTAVLDDPSGYGRVIRDTSGTLQKILEDADLSGDERAVSEINACTYAFERSSLEPALGSLTTDNAQGEYYLTGVVEAFVAGGRKVIPVEAPCEEALGINDREQLARVGEIVRRRINSALMKGGVTMLDPDRTYIDHGVEVGPDTVIMPLVFITGDSSIGSGCRLGPCVEIKDSTVADGASIEFAWLEGVEVGEDVTVGPFSRLRPGCRLGFGSKVGSFVELKDTTVAPGSRAT